MTNQSENWVSGRNSSVDASDVVPTCRSVTHSPALRVMSDTTIAQRGVVSRVALEVVLQAQPEAQVVRALGARARIEREPVAARIADHMVVERVETAAAVERGYALRHRVRIQRFADQVVEQRVGRGLVALGARLDLHEINARRGLARRLATLDIALHVGRAHGERGQLGGLGTRGHFADPDHTRDDAEVEGRGIAEAAAG